ncbi:hypothetical protein FRB93_003847 [Tulasnella sp. JGI-2019a]|nr:hypothetical protein FRB93_003847 [Tulasnella sp. JGI-2019a]
MSSTPQKSAIVQQRRLLFACVTVAFGSMLFGYDSGVMGAAIVLPSFDLKFGLEGSALQIAKVGSNVTSYLTAGSITIAPFAGLMAYYLGRRTTLVMSALCLLIGSIVQVTAGSVHQLYGARFVAGLGVGGSLQMIGMYISEITPPKLRGHAVTLVMVMIYVGSLFSYWISFGTTRHLPLTSDAQWRILFGFQVLLSGLFLIGLMFVPESPRYQAVQQVNAEKKLREQGLPIPPRFPGSARRSDSEKVLDEKTDNNSSDAASTLSHGAAETVPFHPSYASVLFPSRKLADASLAIATLAYIRDLPATDSSVKAEMAEIYAQIDELAAEREKESMLKSAMKPANLKRFLIVIFCGTWQSWSGITALIYYAGTVFASLGLSSTNVSLLAGGIYSVVTLCSATLAALWGISMWGRIRGAQTAGLLLAIIFFTIAAISATHPVNPLSPTVTAASIVTVVLIYFVGIIVTLVLGPILYVYPTEIFPMGLREAGQAVSLMATWVHAFLGAKYITIGMAAIGWKFWLVFGCTNAVCLIIYGFCPETSGKTIEEIDILFGGVSAEERDAHVQERLREAKVSVQAPTTV